jgi:acetylornithine deacetylase/succinyl-diaminopimelate desuccinylase-like protein
MQMYSLLKARCRGLEAETVEFARELIKTPSPGLSEEAVADRVEERMRQLSFDKVLRDEAGNVLGINYGRNGDETILLNSHMDTVEVSRPDRWERSPYSGDLVDGRLHGLGASDCKAGLAAQIYAAELLKRSLLPMNGNVIMAATVAEENGRSIGLGALMHETLPGLGLEPSCALLGEPTAGRLFYGHDGWIELDIRVSLQTSGTLKKVAGLVFEHFNDDKSYPDRSQQPQYLVTEPPVLTSEEAGSEAVVHLSRRLHHGESIEGILQYTQQNAIRALGSSASASVAVQVCQDQQRLYTGTTTTVRRMARAWSIDPFAPFMERSRHALAAAGLDARPGKWELNRLGMGTAGGVLVNEFNVPTVGWGPGEEEQAHQPNESVAVRRIPETVYGTAAIVHSVVGIPVFGWTADEI